MGQNLLSQKGVLLFGKALHHNVQAEREGQELGVPVEGEGLGVPEGEGEELGVLEGEEEQA